VADLSPTHFALLNKYNVVDRHLLIVTHADIDQEALLDAADFEALATAMAGERVIGFYNGGPEAGASQRHKHLQVVRLPLAPAGDAIPMRPLLEDSARRAALPFRHAFAPIAAMDDPRRWARAMHELYRELFARAGLAAVPDPRGERQSGPYNLLVTHDWMLLVPRSAPGFEGIEVNSLAYAGALFARDDEGMRTVRRLGPMAVLRGVAQPKD
jgi:sulfate adenylyltransferase (ADP) / ATP adenylyltransferase